MLIPYFQRDVSIDDIKGEIRDRSFDARLADPTVESQEQRTYRRELIDLVRKAVGSLNERERHVIRNRFGILGGGERTLDEIASGLNLSRERVRQIERIAKAKLRKVLECCSPPTIAWG